MIDDKIKLNACETCRGVQIILQEILAMRPRAVIIDSIQTVYLDDVTGSAGSVSQARAWDESQGE